MSKKALYIKDDFRIDLTKLNPALKQKFKDGLDKSQTDTSVSPPRLHVTVPATHAGIITRNNAFYRPDIMRDGLPSFIAPYNKPVQIHHQDNQDPVGRVIRASYIDSSHKYIESITRFRERYGGFTFVDKKVDYEKAKDQFEWVYDNMLPLKDYSGLGFGELDLSITEQDAANKILDERYLTVSVGFSTTKIRCSACGTDWAEEGPCEHTPGEVHDKYPVVLIPENFLYDEVSWVNTPADQFASVSKVMVTNLQETLQDATENKQMINVTPILLSVGGSEGIYRLDFTDDTDTVEAQEAIEVKTNKKHKEPELTKKDGFQWTSEAIELYDRAKRKNYLIEEGDAGHKHRAILDPATDNGWTDYVDGHVHEIVNKKVLESAKGYWDDETEEYIKEDPHTHPIGKEIPKLDYYDNSDEDRIEDGVKTENKDKSKCKKKKIMNKSDNEETKLIDEDENIPEGWELVEDTSEDDSDSASGSQNSDEDNEGENKDDADDGSWDDSAIEDIDKFYDEFFVPELTDMEMEDAKLSAEQRKKLKASQFCGPDKSFPIPDCAHVTAARRLLSRYKGKGSKKKIKACIERKARSLGCNKKEDQISGIVNFTVADNEYAVATVDAFNEVLKSLDNEVIKENSEKLGDAALLLGISKEDWDAALLLDEVVIAKEPKDLDQTIEEADAGHKAAVTDAVVQDFVRQILELDDETRQGIIDLLIKELTDNELIPDFDQEFNDMVEETEEQAQRIQSLTRTNKDLYLSKQDFLAETLFNISESAKLEGFTDLDDDAKKEKIKELKLSSIDILSDKLTQVTDKVINSLNEPGINKKDVAPGDVETPDVTIEDTAQGEIEEPKRPIDVSIFKGCNEDQYRLIRRLQDVQKRNKLAKKMNN